MKKHFLIFCLMLLGINAFSSKVFDVHFTISDAYTAEPLANVFVEIVIDKKGVARVLGSGKSDSLGKVEISGIEGSVIHVKVTSPNADFADKEFDYFTNRGKDCHLALFMYPSESQLERWLSMEDSNYGLNGIGSLTEDANDMDHVYGCLKEDFVDAFYDSTATAILSYIKKNLRYPLESSEQSEQGRVFTRFIIEKDGKLSHIEIIRGVSPFIDQEAIRLLRSMDLWSPAKCSGQKIRTRAEMAINFELEY